MYHGFIDFLRFYVRCFCSKNALLMNYQFISWQLTEYLTLKINHSELFLSLLWVIGFNLFLLNAGSDKIHVDISITLEQPK